MKRFQGQLNEHMFMTVKLNLKSVLKRPALRPTIIMFLRELAMH